MKFKLLLPSLFLFLYSSLHSFAGGFQINTQGSKALGMGGAFTGVANDASCIYFNPGGMSGLTNRHELYTGLSLIIPNVSVHTVAVDNTDQTSPVATPIQFYYIYKLNEKLTVGMLVNNQFGARSTYPDNWEGRYIVQELSLKTFMFQPSIGYAFKDWLQVGAGFVYATGDFELRQAAPLQTATTSMGEAHLTGSGKSTGFNIGVLSKVKNYFTLGIDYRSSLKVNLNNGKAEFTNFPAAVLDRFPAETSFTSSVTLPAVLCVGISRKFYDEKWTIALDFWRTYWSSYDTLRFDFANEKTPDVKSARNFKDVNFIGFGASYQYKPSTIFRAGTFYDFSPMQNGYISPELPDKNTWGFSFGVGIKFGERVTVDLSYLHYTVSMIGASLTEQNFIADYNKSIDVIDFGFNFKFGKNMKDLPIAARGPDIK